MPSVVLSEYEDEFETAFQSAENSIQELQIFHHKSPRPDIYIERRSAGQSRHCS
jgi:hypothetical protein